MIKKYLFAFLIGFSFTNLGIAQNLQKPSSTEINSLPDWAKKNV